MTKGKEVLWSKNIYLQSPQHDVCVCLLYFIIIARQVMGTCLDFRAMIQNKIKTEDFNITCFIKQYILYLNWETLLFSSKPANPSRITLILISLKILPFLILFPPKNDFSVCWWTFFYYITHVFLHFIVHRCCNFFLCTYLMYHAKDKHSQENQTLFT